jgi:hypothetical protein
VPAAFDKQALGHRATHGTPDIDPGNGAAGAGPAPAGFERNRKSGTAELFL